MKKSDYNRVLSLYKNSGVDLETCIQLIIQMANSSTQASEYIIKLLVDTLGYVSRINK